MKIIAPFAAIILILLPSHEAQARLRWRIYIDKNYGYSIPVPANLRLLPWTGDPERAWQIRNRDFESRDGKVGLYLTTHFTLGRSLQNFFNREFASRLNGGDGINYWVVKPNWYVISGTNSL